MRGLPTIAMMKFSVIALLPLLVLGCASAYRAPKPAMVTRQQWGSKPDPIPDSELQTPVWITIHHAGVLWKKGEDPTAVVRALQVYGQRRPEIEKPPRNTFWPDLPYHFLIAPDGRIFQGRPIKYAPETNTDYEVRGNICIELMGNFQLQRPSEAQLKSSVALTAWLCQKYHIGLNHVRGHRDAAPGQTVCPGKDFYRYLKDGQFRHWVAAEMHDRRPNVHPGAPLPGGPTADINQ